jgi:hypothetical protein
MDWNKQLGLKNQPHIEKKSPQITGTEAPGLAYNK